MKGLEGPNLFFASKRVKVRIFCLQNRVVSLIEIRFHVCVT